SGRSILLRDPALDREPRVLHRRLRFPSRIKCRPADHPLRLPCLRRLSAHLHRALSLVGPLHGAEEGEGVQRRTMMNVTNDLRIRRYILAGIMLAVSLGMVYAGTSGSVSVSVPLRERPPALSRRGCSGGS